MTRVPNDCFCDPGRVMTAAEALALLKAGAKAVTGTETVPLIEAAGRILATPPVAPRPIPAHDYAAMDGYGFAFQADERRYRVVGRVTAGHPFAGKVGPGEAVRIFTGAPLPVGIDTVAMQEDVSRDGDWAIMPAGLAAGENRRLAGEDVAAGTAPVPARARLKPQHVAMLAAMGVADVSVHQRLKIAVFSSGDEIREPGAPLPEGGVYDANRHFLMSALNAWGYDVDDLGILPDNREVVEAALTAAASRHDVVLTSAGASQGEEDHVVRTVERLGALSFWRLAIKPGRPLGLGRLGQAAFIGLPGNPVAAALGLLRFARPLLSVLAGGAWLEPTPSFLPAAFALTKKAGRREYLRGRRCYRDGAVTVERYAKDGSGILSSLVASDGFIELAEEVTSIAPGDVVPFVPFNELGL